MLNETLQIISIVLCLVGILQVLVGPKRWRGSVFFHIVFYIALFNYAISILLGLILEGHEGELVHRVMFISNFLEFISGYSLTFFVIKWLLHCVDPMREVKEIRVANILALVLYVLQLLMVIVSQFTGLCYSIGNDNYLQFGEGFFLLVLMWVPSLLLALYVLIRFGKRLPVRYIISFSIFAVISATGVAAQFFLIDIYYITIASSVCALVLYLLTVRDSSEMYLYKERESDRLKIDMMLSQIQPHFIFNSLTVIKHFCRYDPKLAEKAILDFSRFLRGNMDSLNSREPIYFNKELEHTKAYLSLEKYRFGEDLDILYDIQATQFVLPPLTLQPIVENAVRHGIRETPDGKGTVTIMTREYDDRNEIVVRDDGKGFEPQNYPDSDKPHIGIENVRYRLKNMCNGTLTIDSVIGQGTVAVISVPKGDKMLIYAIDDEKIQLLELQDAIKNALPEANVQLFQNANDALRTIENEGKRPDLVFSDIRMPGIDGLQLAVRIKTASPDTKIIFVTGYSQYAMDAFRVHANGYLMKPVRPEDIIEEVMNLQLPFSRLSNQLNVQCFGNLEVFWHEAPLEFKRRKTKELFAYLIDQEGTLCSAEDISAALWEDEADIRKAKHRLRNMVSDLRSSLKSVGQEAILIRKSGLLAIKRDSVDCDYYRMLDGDMEAVNSFRVEYMKQFVWCQDTEAKLHFRK